MADPVMNQGSARVGYMCDGSMGDIGPNISSGQGLHRVWEGMLKNHHRAKKIFSYPMATYMSQLWARKYLREYLNVAPGCITCRPSRIFHLMVLALSSISWMWLGFWRGSYKCLFLYLRTVVSDSLGPKKYSRYIHPLCYQGSFTFLGCLDDVLNHPSS